MEITEIKTSHPKSVTTEGLQDLKKILFKCYQEKNNLKEEITQIESKLRVAKNLMVFSYILIFGVFIKWFKKNKKDKEEYLENLKNQLDRCFINVDVTLDEQVEEKYNNLIENYKTLLSCEYIWDVTASAENDQRKTRSAASTEIIRKEVKFGYGKLDIIKSKYKTLHFENANGGDLYIYPSFVIIINTYENFGIVDIKELKFNFDKQNFLEQGKIPNDAIVEGYMWAKVNKNGTPDKRFKDNYQIPICKYGEIRLSSTTGINEAYCLSSYEKTEKFAQSMMEYQTMIK